MTISGDGSDNSSSNISTGAISILHDNLSNDYDTVLETVHELRWKNTDPRSKADGGVLYDYFDVTIKW